VREEPQDHVVIGKPHRCGGFGYAVGRVGKGCVWIPFDSGKWDCPKCVHILIKIWMERIESDLPGVVLYSVRTRLQGKDLSARIRRNFGKGRTYFCIHLNDGALVFRNGKFKGSTPRSRKVFLNEVRQMMENGEVIHMSRGPRTRKKNPTPMSKRWVYAHVNEEILPEYCECKNDYEIGLLLRRYRFTSKVKSLTKLGEELLRRIRAGEINKETPNLSDLEGE
jgi:hypothetical protein